MYREINRSQKNCIKYQRN